MMQKNQYFTAECIDYTYDGLGIVKVENFPFFVKGMLKGEVGELKVIKLLKSYGVARLISLTKTSENRADPVCPVYKACGGCHLQHFSIVEQQNFKTKYVVDCMERIAKQSDLKEIPCKMMDEGLYYRNKVQLPCGKENGHFITGFYKQHTNEIIKNDFCYIQNKKANILQKRVKEILDDLKVSAYDKTTHKGLMRHILIKAGYHTDDLMLVLITNGEKFRNKEILVEKLTKEFPNLRTIIQMINERHDNVILGEKEIILYGDGYIEDYLGDIHFQISAKSFYQVNPSQAEILYQYALDACNLTGNETVIDAYCGIGTISLFLAKKAKKVLGVEIVEQAIEDAKKNAKFNHIDNVEFIADDAKNFMQNLASKNEHIDVVVCDPPRKGCSKEFLDAIHVLKPNRVVYVSCNVATQARDVVILNEFGYQLEYVQPVDMFPMTNGVESVALFTLKEGEGHE